MKAESSTKTEYSSPEVESVVYGPYADGIADGALKGKTFAVTGCTSGTGLVAAKLFAQKGGDVILLNRASPRASAALEAVRKAAAGGKVSHVDCDLMDFASVRAAAKGVLAEADALDVLCNNAGVMALEDKATKDGYDVQMQTNHLSHFLLTKELYPALVKASELRGEARIVNHSSLARQMGPPLTAEAAFEFLGKNGGNLGGNGEAFGEPGRWTRYHHTKLANVVFTLALKEKLPPAIKALACAPGLAATNLAAVTHNDGVGMIQGFMDSGPPCQSGEDGAVPLIHCCVAADAKSGEFYEPADHGGWTGPAALKPLSGPGADEKDAVIAASDQDALWTASEAACGAFAL